MSKPRVIVLSVIQQGLSVSEAATKFGVSRQWVHQLLTRYRDGGLDAVNARSHRPRTNPHQTPPELRDQIIRLRHTLTAQGLDAGPVTIAWHLTNDGLTAPSTSTIPRILHTAGLVTPAPKKRPRSSYRRFEAAQPNECWQSDFTHWHLADGTDIDILNWLDDHSRYLLSITALSRVTGPHIVTTFLHTTAEYGCPQSTLTDNGLVYTARFRGERNAFETLLADLGVTQKNGHPGHPQTQGKIERFHQTLKRWLTSQPPAATLPDLQHQLAAFHQLYNHHRVHHAHGHTPATAYTTTPPATPPTTPHRNDHYRIRTDTIDRFGKLTLRHTSRLHHLGIGAEHANTPILILIDNHTVEVTNPATGQHHNSHTINPTKNYWPNTQKSPGRWPGLSSS